jgi:hypothetical protein
VRSFIRRGSVTFEGNLDNVEACVERLGTVTFGLGTVTFGLGHTLVTRAS